VTVVAHVDQVSIAANGQSIPSLCRVLDWKLVLQPSIRVIGFGEDVSGRHDNKSLRTLDSITIFFVFLVTHHAPDGGLIDCSAPGTRGFARYILICNCHAEHTRTVWGFDFRQCDGWLCKNAIGFWIIWIESRGRKQFH